MTGEPRTTEFRTPSRRRQAVTFVLLVAVVLLAGWIAFDRLRSDREADLARGNAESLAEQVRATCDQGGETAAQLGDLCQQAEQVAEEPAEPIAVAPTDEQLRPLVQQYVEEWLTEFPPQDGRDAPTVAELTVVIADLIADELERNPPPAGEDGETPTVEQLRPIVVEAVAAHLLANPPPPGEPGRDGQDGTDGTPGRDGTDGADGADGEPPHSWISTRCDLLGQCTTERCERTDPFDEQLPTYTCSPVDG